MRNWYGILLRQSEFPDWGKWAANLASDFFLNMPTSSLALTQNITFKWKALFLYVVVISCIYFLGVCYASESWNVFI